MPGILKIGKTIRTPEIRLNESNKLGDLLHYIKLSLLKHKKK